MIKEEMKESIKKETETAIIDKEAYDGKREWAASRMEENKKVSTLTQEQHELLEELCKFRHDLHTNWESAFNDESSSFTYYEENISTYSVGNSGEELPCRIEKAFGEMPFSPIDYPTSADYADYGLSYEEAFDRACDEFDKVNNEIETFLSKVDKKHGTHYCPEGATRLY